MTNNTMTVNTARPRRRRGQHGVHPLSARTRRKLLAALLQRAEAGDVQAAKALIELSSESECEAIEASATDASGEQ